MQPPSSGLYAAWMPDAELGQIPPLAPDQAAAYRAGMALRTDAAARALGWVQRCVSVVLESPHPFPRGEARIALLQAPPAQVVAALLPALTSEHRRLRRRAMTLLPRLDADEVVRQLDGWLPAGEHRRTARRLRRPGRTRRSSGTAPPTPHRRLRTRSAAPGRARARAPGGTCGAARTGAVSAQRCAPLWPHAARQPSASPAAILRGCRLQLLLRCQFGRTDPQRGSRGRGMRLDRWAGFLLSPFHQGHGLVAARGTPALTCQVHRPRACRGFRHCGGAAGPRRPVRVPR